MPLLSAKLLAQHDVTSLGYQIRWELEYDPNQFVTIKGYISDQDLHDPRALHKMIKETLKTYDTMHWMRSMAKF